MLEGYDVSHHQAPGTIPWTGADFAMARVTMGAAGVDKFGWTHLHQAAIAGVPILVAYHFLRGDSAGVPQAVRFLDRVSALDERIGPVGIIVDVEPPDPPALPWDLGVYRATLLDFLAHVRATSSRRCLIYGPGAYLRLLKLPEEVAELHPLHLADWSGPATVPAPWKDWTIHQYSTTGGVLDRNRFRGTRDELRAVLGLAGEHAHLGNVVTGVRAAEGRGKSVEDFVSRDEGPVVD